MKPLSRLLLLFTIFLGLVVTFVAHSNLSGGPDKATTLDRLRNLGLDSLQSGIWVHYQPEYEDRAAQLGSLLNSATRYLNDSLGIAPKQAPALRLALVDSSDWQRLRPSPYGLPYISSNGGSSVAVLPVDGKGSVYRFVVSLEQKLSGTIRKQLDDAGYTWDEAARTMVDLISLHELGHAYRGAMGIGKPALWFDELVATYIACLFLQNQQPDLANIWNLTSLVVKENYEPKNRSLESFDRLYTRVGVANYAWYQSAFEEKANRLTEQHGFSFVRQMTQIFPGNTPLMSADKIVKRVETAYPGFEHWATHTFAAKNE